MKKLTILTVILLMMSLMGNRAETMRSAYANGSYDLKEMTPEVTEALRGRSERFNNLTTLKSVGKIGENNEGYVKNLSGDTKVETVVKEENRDREVIYQAVVKQNNLPANSIFTVRSVFAEVQNKKARPGEQVQLPNGKWVTKS